MPPQAAAAQRTGSTGGAARGVRAEDSQRGAAGWHRPALRLRSSWGCICVAEVKGSINCVFDFWG